MRLIPLKQWICDTCGSVIRQPNEGELVWINYGKAYGFKIVHKIFASPHRQRGCSPYKGHPCGEGSAELDDDETQRLAMLLIYLAPGLGLTQSPDEVENMVAHVPKFVEVMRRLLIPYYEQGRIYFSQAMQDGYLDPSSNELTICHPPMLKELIDRYTCTTRPTLMHGPEF